MVLVVVQGNFDPEIKNERPPHYGVLLLEMQRLDIQLYPLLFPNLGGSLRGRLRSERKKMGVLLRSFYIKLKVAQNV